MTDDFKLEKELDALFPPAPTTRLAEQISAKAAETAQFSAAANDRGISWQKMSAIAAVLIAFAAVGLTYINGPSETEQWEMMAETTGFSDIHDWVYAEEG